MNYDLPKHVPVNPYWTIVHYVHQKSAHVTNTFPFKFNTVSVYLSGMSTYIYTINYLNIYKHVIWTLGILSSLSKG